MTAETAFKKFPKEGGYHKIFEWQEDTAEKLQKLIDQTKEDIELCKYSDDEEDAKFFEGKIEAYEDLLESLK